MIVPERPDAEAILRRMIQSDVPPLVRAILHEELANGWGEHRRLVEHELGRLDKESDKVNESIALLRESIAEINTCAKQIHRDVERVEGTTKGLSKQLTDVRVEHAKSGGLWGAIAAFVLVVLTKLAEIAIGR